MATLKPSFLAICLLATTLTGCDQLGIETPDKVAARQEAEGKAVGGACRHAGRALEDCYENNRRASKAAVYAGWRDMDGYMRENNIAVVKPAASEEEAPAKTADAKSESKTEDGSKKTTEKPDSSHAIEKADAKSGAAAHPDKSGKAVTKTS